MPVYLYDCEKCGEVKELFKNMTDPDLTVCPDCKGSLKRVYGIAGIAFKGKGFYSTGG